MRDVIGRLMFAVTFALLAGAVAFWNPVAHLDARIRKESHGIRTSLTVAKHELIKQWDGGSA